MYYYVRNHQHKGRPYHLALHAAGHHPKAAKADVVLVDRDRYIQTPDSTLAYVQNFIDQGAVIMIYPHSALPPWWYDGLVPFSDYIKCVIVIGEGQKDAMRIIAPEADVFVVGWPWCPQKPFSQPEQLKIVNFAPIHPSGGVLRPEAVRANRAILSELKTVQKETGCRVVIRYIEKLRLQGLHPYEGFEWVEGRKNGATEQIDQADIVIAEGTYLYQAVARGKPAIGINQHLPVRANKNSNQYTPHNWDKYGPDLAYPINYGDAQLQDLIDRAMTEEQTAWRERFIGEDLNRLAFAETAVSIHLENRK
jgi:hypothetical protein